jgi:hypothetical protein
MPVGHDYIHLAEPRFYFDRSIVAVWPANLRAGRMWVIGQHPADREVDPVFRDGLERLV